MNTPDKANSRRILLITLFVLIVAGAVAAYFFWPKSKSQLDAENDYRVIADSAQCFAKAYSGQYGALTGDTTTQQQCMPSVKGVGGSLPSGAKLTDLREFQNGQFSEIHYAIGGTLGVTPEYCSELIKELLPTVREVAVWNSKGEGIANFRASGETTLANSRPKVDKKAIAKGCQAVSGGFISFHSL